MFSKEQILDLHRKEVDVPEFGGKLFVRELTMLESAHIYIECQKHPEEERQWWDTFHLLAAGIVDEEGKQVFSPEEIAAMPKGKSSALLKLREAILGDGLVLEKNSETPTNGNSSSPLP